MDMDSFLQTYEQKQYKRGRPSPYELKKSNKVIAMHNRVENVIDRAFKPDWKVEEFPTVPKRFTEDDFSRRKHGTEIAIKNLEAEKFQQSRMGFSKKAMSIEERISKIRKQANKEQEAMDKRILERRLAFKRFEHKKMIEQFENDARDIMKKLESELKQERRELLKQQETQIQSVITETRETVKGKVRKQCSCPQPYLCRHNRKNGTSLRKPSKKLVELRKRAMILSNSGYTSEALVWQEKAMNLDRQEELDWKKKISSSVFASPWGANDAKLDNLMVTHNEALVALDERHHFQRRKKLHAIGEKRKVMLYKFDFELNKERTKIKKHDFVKALPDGEVKRRMTAFINKDNNYTPFGITNGTPIFTSATPTQTTSSATNTNNDHQNHDDNNINKSNSHSNSSSSSNSKMDLNATSDNAKDDGSHTDAHNNGNGNSNSNSSNIGELTEGSKVEAKSNSGSDWLRVEIIKDHKNGRYDIKYEDGHIDTQIIKGDLRLSNSGSVDSIGNGNGSDYNSNETVKAAESGNQDESNKDSNNHYNNNNNNSLFSPIIHSNGATTTPNRPHTTGTSSRPHVQHRRNNDPLDMYVPMTKSDGESISHILTPTAPHQSTRPSSSYTPSRSSRISVSGLVLGNYSSTLEMKQRLIARGVSSVKVGDNNSNGMSDYDSGNSGNNGQGPESDTSTNRILFADGEANMNTNTITYPTSPTTPTTSMNATLTSHAVSEYEEEIVRKGEINDSDFMNISQSIPTSPERVLYQPDMVLALEDIKIRDFIFHEADAFTNRMDAYATELSDLEQELQIHVKQETFSIECSRLEGLIDIELSNQVELIQEIGAIEARISYLDPYSSTSNNNSNGYDNHIHYTHGNSNDSNMGTPHGTNKYHNNSHDDHDGVHMVKKKHQIGDENGNSDTFHDIEAEKAIEDLKLRLSELQSQTLLLKEELSSQKKLLQELEVKAKGLAFERARTAELVKQRKLVEELNHSNTTTPYIEGDSSYGNSSNKNHNNSHRRSRSAGATTNPNPKGTKSSISNIRNTRSSGSRSRNTDPIGVTTSVYNNGDYNNINPVDIGDYDHNYNNYNYYINHSDDDGPTVSLEDNLDNLNSSKFEPSLYNLPSEIALDTSTAATISMNMNSNNYANNFNSTNGLDDGYDDRHSNNNDNDDVLMRLPMSHSYSPFEGRYNNNNNNNNNYGISEIDYYHNENTNNHSTSNANDSDRNQIGAALQQMSLIQTQLLQLLQLQGHRNHIASQEGMGVDGANFPIHELEKTIATSMNAFNNINLNMGNANPTNGVYDNTTNPNFNNMNLMDMSLTDGSYVLEPELIRTAGSPSPMNQLNQLNHVVNVGATRLATTTPTEFTNTDIQSDTSDRRSSGFERRKQIAAKRITAIVRRASGVRRNKREEVIKKKLEEIAASKIAKAYRRHSLVENGISSNDMTHEDDITLPEVSLGPYGDYMIPSSLSKSDRTKGESTLNADRRISIGNTTSIALTRMHSGLPDYMKDYTSKSNYNIDNRDDGFSIAPRRSPMKTIIDPNYDPSTRSRSSSATSDRIDRKGSSNDGVSGVRPGSGSGSASPRQQKVLQEIREIVGIAVNGDTRDDEIDGNNPKNSNREGPLVMEDHHVDRNIDRLMSNHDLESSGDNEAYKNDNHKEEFDEFDEQLHQRTGQLHVPTALDEVLLPESSVVRVTRKDSITVDALLSKAELSSLEATSQGSTQAVSEEAALKERIEIRRTSIRDRLKQREEEKEREKEREIWREKERKLEEEREKEREREKVRLKEEEDRKKEIEQERQREKERQREEDRKKEIEQQRQREKERQREEDRKRIQEMKEKRAASSVSFSEVDDVIDYDAPDSDKMRSDSRIKAPITTNNTNSNTNTNTNTSNDASITDPSVAETDSRVASSTKTTYVVKTLQSGAIDTTAMLNDLLGSTDEDDVETDAVDTERKEKEENERKEREENERKEKEENERKEKEENERKEKEENERKENEENERKEKKKMKRKNSEGNDKSKAEKEMKKRRKIEEHLRKHISETLRILLLNQPTYEFCEDKASKIEAADKNDTTFKCLRMLKGRIRLSKYGKEDTVLTPRNAKIYLAEGLKLALGCQLTSYPSLKEAIKSNEKEGKFKEAERSLFNNFVLPLIGTDELWGIGKEFFEKVQAKSPNKNSSNQLNVPEQT